jgi:hypothetical protein
LLPSQRRRGSKTSLTFTRQPRFSITPTANFTLPSALGGATLKPNIFGGGACRNYVAAWWFRQAQPPCMAVARCRKVVSTGSTTAFGGSTLPLGGFDRLNHCAWLYHVAAWWFRQAQPPRMAVARCRMVVSTGSTTAYGGSSLPHGGFDRLNHRAWR